MTQLKFLNFQRFTLSKRREYLRMILTLAKADTDLCSLVPTDLTSFESAFNAEEGLLILSNKSALTPVIEQADKDRDKLYSGFRKYVQYKTLSTNAAEAAAAEALESFLSTGKIRVAVNRSSQSAVLTEVFQKLEDSFSSELTTLGLTDELAELKAKNQLVRDTMAERYAEWSKKPKGLGKTLRKQTNACYNQLVSKINANQTLGTTTKLESFVTQANAIISDFLPSASSDTTSTDDSGSSSSSSSSSTTTKKSFTVTLTASPSAGGTVGGGGSFEEGSTITVVATPASGYSFSAWSDGSTDASHSVTVSADTSLTATFTTTSSDAGDNEGFHT